MQATIQTANEVTFSVMTRLLRVELKRTVSMVLLHMQRYSWVSHDPFISDADAEVERLLLNVLI